MGWLSKLFDPGKGSRDAAGRAGEAGVIKGFNFSGPGGIGGGFNFNKGIGSASTSLGAFENPFQQLIASGMAGTSGAGMDALTGTAGAVTDRLGQPLNVQQMSGQGDYNMLGGLMGNAAGIAQKDPFELGATI